MAAKKKADTARKTTKRKKAERPQTTGDVREIEVLLKGTDPRIWRRFAVRADITLAKLHDVVQVVMGWTNSHLHLFTTPDHKRYGPRLPELGLGLEDDTLDERKARLCDVAPARGTKLLYEYDFGDSWEHALKVLKVGPPEPGVRYPVCLSGERACPPEDCGGVWGYYDFLQAMADPKHEQHDEMVEWHGCGFDADAFNLDAVNAMLRRL